MNKPINKILSLAIFLSLFYISSSLSCSAQQLAQGIEPTIESSIVKDIVGSKKQKKAQPKNNVPEELITFSARNISVKDAFATLARISGKSISVGSDIRDNEEIAVIEIKELSFIDAFHSLVDAARVDYTQTGESLTVVKSAANRKVMIFGLGASQVDRDLPALERYADLSYDNQDLATLLKDLANKYGIDIVLTATPTERVSARVRQVNITDALALVLSGTSFDYTIVGEDQDQFIIYNRLNKNFTVGQKSRLFSLMNLEAMDVQALLPVQIRANVRISNDQNAIIADGSPNDLKRIKEFLEEIDKPLPQVELEVKLVEVQKSAQQELMLLQNPLSVGDFTRVAQNQIPKFLGDAPSADNLAVVNGGVSTFKLNAENILLFNNQVTLLEQRGLAQVRAHPKLVSLSGRTAMINIDTDTNLVLGAATGQGQQIGVVATQQLQRITAGTALSITPVVGTGGLISAMVQIEVSDNSGTTEQNGVTIPQNTTRRRISNEIQVRDGETVVIGGLIQDNASVTRQGFPVISRIPIIGDWLSNRIKQKNQSELIVLITPRIRNIPNQPKAAATGIISPGT